MAFIIPPPRRLVAAAVAVSVIAILSLAQMSQLALPGDALHGYKLFIEDVTGMSTIDKLDRRLIELDHTMANLAPASSIVDTLKLIAVTANFVQCTSSADTLRLTEARALYNLIGEVRGPILFGAYSSSELTSIVAAGASAGLALEAAISRC